MFAHQSPCHRALAPETSMKRRRSSIEALAPQLFRSNSALAAGNVEAAGIEPPQCSRRRQATDPTSRCRRK
jgi:hypothetical protein